MPTKTKLLLDTNLLVYVFDQTSPFHLRATAVLNDPSVELFLTTKSISEYFAVCSKQKAPLDDVLIFYRSFCKNATILFPETKSLRIFETLLRKYQPIGNRVFDLEIAAVGLANGVSDIATFNQKDFIALAEISLWPV